MVIGLASIHHIGRLGESLAIRSAQLSITLSLVHLLYHRPDPSLSFLYLKSRSFFRIIVRLELDLPYCSG